MKIIYILIIILILAFNINHVFAGGGDDFIQEQLVVNDPNSFTIKEVVMMAIGAGTFVLGLLIWWLKRNTKMLDKLTRKQNEK